MKLLLIILLIPLTLYSSSEFSLDEKILLTLPHSEQKIMERGELGVFRYTTSGIIGTVPGFGIGHAIQGRWQDKGWIFTFGELVSSALFIGGVSTCAASLFLGCNEGVLLSGYLGFIFFKSWEIIDIWYGGYRHRKDYKRIKNKLKGLPEPPKTKLSLLPEITTESTALRLVYSF